MLIMTVMIIAIKMQAAQNKSDQSQGWTMVIRGLGRSI